MKAMPQLLAALLVATILAGCSDSSKGDSKGPEVEVDEDTGGVRGFVVDESVRPVEGATVTIVGLGTTTTTDAEGRFAIGMLPPGPTGLEVTHPLYARAQAATTVVAGVADPEYLRVTLTRTIFGEPYAFTVRFDGFIACSVGTYAFLSEECGEGAGVPCEVPEVGCDRVGGQDSNAAQFDFLLDNVDAKTILVEQVWEPNSAETGEFYTYLATNWTCDPQCGGNTLELGQGASPLIIRHDIKDGTVGSATVTKELMFSTFTWPNTEDDPTAVNAALNQKYQIFLTISYLLPLPEGWSFIDGSPPPFG